MDKRKLTIIVLSILCGLSMIVNGVQLYQANNQSKLLEKTEQQLAKKKKVANKQKQELKDLDDEVAILNASMNNKGNSASQIAFNEVSKNFMKAMFDFSPNSYKERKEKLTPLISDELLNQYFPKNGHYGDSNGVTSKVDELNIYAQAVQGENMNGIAVITFESKSGDSAFTKQTEIYQLTMDTKTNKLIKVQDLGSVTKGSDLND